MREPVGWSAVEGSIRRIVLEGHGKIGLKNPPVVRPRYSTPHHLHHPPSVPREGKPTGKLLQPVHSTTSAADWSKPLEGFSCWATFTLDQADQHSVILETDAAAIAARVSRPKADTTDIVINEQTIMSACEYLSYTPVILVLLYNDMRGRR